MEKIEHVMLPTSIFSGCYNTIWSDNSTCGDDGEEIGLTIDIKDVGRILSLIIQNDYQEFGILKVEYESYSSPREYNFTTDTIYVSVTFDRRICRSVIENNMLDFQDILSSHHKSRSGFASFYEYDYQKISDPLSHIYMMDYLDLCNSLSPGAEDDAFEHCNGNGYFKEACDDSN